MDLQVGPRIGYEVTANDLSNSMFDFHWWRLFCSGWRFLILVLPTCFSCCLFLICMWSAGTAATHGERVRDIYVVEHDALLGLSSQHAIHAGFDIRSVGSVG